MIKTENLSKIFFTGFLRKKKLALDSLNLEVRENEIFGFLGPNGAGKTTSIKLFLGLLKPSAGQVKIFGQDVYCQSVRAKIGYLPENPYFYDYLTAGEFLNYVGRLCNLKKAVRHSRIKELLAMLELEESKDLQLRNFSKGMLQRLGIAQALINDPQLLILDEPMAGLDPAGRKKIRDLLVDLKNQGKTIFFSTHILWDVELICDRVGILLEGKLKNTGKLSDMLKTESNFSEIVFKEVTVEGLAEIKKIFSRVEEKDDKVVALAKNDFETETALALVSHKKCKIFSITPQRKTLEDIFVKETLKEAGDRAQKPKTRKELYAVLSSRK